MYNRYSITKLARDLRKRQTESERLLWEELRGRKLNGFKFLRQYPIVYLNINKQLYFFIADFYCDEKKTVIELDGKIHDFQKNYDEQRDLVLKEKGLRILRLKNEELADLMAVKEKINCFLQTQLD